MSNVIKLLSIDPGLTMLGWSVLQFDIDTGVLTVMRLGTIKSIKGASKDKEFVELYGNRTSALLFLEVEFKRLIDQVKPDVVITEDAFYNPKRPQAFLSLSLCIFIIEKILAVGRYCPFYKLAPRYVKKIITDSGGADKVAVQTAIVNNPQILFKESKQLVIEKLTEHEGDAIAVGWAFASQQPRDVLLSLVHV